MGALQGRIPFTRPVGLVVSAHASLMLTVLALCQFCIGDASLPEVVSPSECLAARYPYSANRMTFGTRCKNPAIRNCSLLRQACSGQE